MSNTESYNGWTNKPTWLVKLWIDNDQPTQEMWLNVARRTVAAAKRPTADTYVLSPESRAAYMLAHKLQDEFEEQNSRIISQASLTSDLFSYVLACVNWDEVATSLIEDASEIPA